MFAWVMSGALGCLAYIDWKKRSLTRRELGIAMMVLLAGSLMEPIGFLNRMAGGAFGLLLLAVCYMSREQLGKGDALVLLCCGIAAGLRFAVSVTAGAFLLAGISGMVLLFFRKIGRKSRLPFLPFVFAAQLFVSFGIK